MLETQRNLSTEAKREALRRRLLARIQKPVLAPLSFSQERLWFLEQFVSEGALFCETKAVRVAAAADVGVLREAVDEVVERHEVLRTTFVSVEGRPLQCIASKTTIELPLVDLGEVDVSRRDAAVHGLAEEVSRRPFDLVHGPLIRFAVVRLGAAEHLVVVTVHHIVADGWSVSLLIREIVGRCLAILTGKGPALPELRFQYADFARWQRDALQGAALERQTSYWREQLDGFSKLELPTDRPRKPERSWRGASLRFELPADLFGAIKQRSQSLGATLFVSLVACFQALLARYSGAEDIAVGTPTAGRTRPETDKLIGCFVNMLVLRTDLAGDPTFRELVERVREVCLGALAHQDLPFEKLVDELRPPRELGREPLFETVIALLPDLIEMPDVSGMREYALDVDNKTSKYDLTLFFWEGSRTLKGLLQYNTDIFDRATVERAVGHLLVMLEATTADPGKRLWELPLLTQAELEHLLLQAEGPHSEYPSATGIQELFAAQVRRAPDAVALVREDARLSYRELSRRASGVARRLLALGVRPEEPVGLASVRSFELIIGMLGILEAGGVYLPLDPDLPVVRMRFMLEDAAAVFVLAEPPASGLATKLAGAKVQVLSLVERATTHSEPPRRIPARPAPDPLALAYVNYTSGSAGVPKGVGVTHRAVARLLFGIDYVSLGPDQTLLHLSSPSFDASTFEIWGALLHGAQCVLYPERVPTAFEMTHTIDRYGVTTMWLTSSLYNALIDDDCSGLARLDQLLVGGEALSVEHVRRGLDTLETTRLVNGYGPTESTTFACCFPIPRELDVETTSIPIGRPIGNTRVYVLDRGLNPAPEGMPGEVVIGGAGLARGYLARPSLTAERFVPDALGRDPGGRLYRSGDLGRWNRQRQLEYLGRADGQVKLRGHRIELGEVESALLSHPGVRRAAAAVQGDRLVGFVVALRSAGAISGTRDAPGKTDAMEDVSPELVSALRRHLMERFPGYMVPSSIVILDELPLTPRGKLDRERLPKRDGSRRQGTVGYVAPRDALERELSKLWSEVLGVERVGVHDDFFELGGHSLLATQLVSRLREAFEVEIPLRRMFEQPTVAGLSEAITQTRRGLGARPIEPIARGGELALSFAQQRLLFLDQLAPGNPFYNVAWAVRLEGAVNLPLLDRTFNEIVRRHETLRTSFARNKGAAVPVIAEALQLRVPVVDLAAASPSRREEELSRLAGAETRRGFDLESGPLIRVCLLRLGEEEHAVLLTMHHIVSDGWSMGVLVREVAALYGAFSRGEPSPLAELRIQYADFAHWQREWLSGEVLEEQLSYWRQRLTGFTPLKLPTDRPRREAERFLGARFKVEVPKEVTWGLGTLSRSEDVTLFMTLLAAFQTLLYRYTGQNDVSVGSAIANRNRAEIEDLIGFFVNTLVMRTDLSGNPSFRQLLRRVKEVALGAYAHQDVPFERLVEELQPERDLSLQPLVQAMFVLQNAPVELGSREHSFSAAPADEKDGGAHDAVRFSVLEPDNDTAKFDLEVHVWEQRGSLQTVFMYNTDLFDDATIRRMSRRYFDLLASVAANPDGRIDDVAIGEKLELPPIRPSGAPANPSEGHKTSMVSGRPKTRSR